MKAAQYVHAVVFGEVLHLARAIGRNHDLVVAVATSVAAEVYRKVSCM
jgi:hypothetical protein